MSDHSKVIKTFELKNTAIIFIANFIYCKICLNLCTHLDEDCISAILYYIDDLIWTKSTGIALSRVNRITWSIL